MKRILVTGATGMVGRNLVEHPAMAEHEVIALGGRSALDLTDAAAVSAFVAAHPVDMVVHAAGRVGGIEANRRANAGFLHDNYMMGANVMHAAHRHGVPRVLNLGSSCMYPRDVPGTLRESMLLSGELEPTNEGYAIAKLAVMRLGDFLQAESDGAFQCRTLVPCNLYGPYDEFDPERSHLAPAMIRKVHEAAARGGSVTIWGDGQARREMMYVGDLCDCIVRAIERWDTLPEHMNVGPGRDHTIDEYYEATARALGVDVRFEHDLGRPVGMRRKLMDVGPSTAWGFTPATSLEDGIARTYRWYRATYG